MESSVRAIIFGATGMVGEGVLHEALRDPTVVSVLVIGRRPCNVADSKLTEIVHSDFFDYAAIHEHLRGYNACFFCLGVSSIGRKELEYRLLTYDLTMAAARALAAVNPDMTFCYVSGAGTDATERGRIMWARVKGKTENDLRRLPFRAVYAYRPGYIRPIPGLKNAFAAARWIAPLYPLLEKLFPRHVCTLEDLGRSMIRIAREGYPKDVLECVDIAASSRH